MIGDREGHKNPQKGQGAAHQGILLWQGRTLPSQKGGQLLGGGNLSAWAGYFLSLHFFLSLSPPLLSFFLNNTSLGVAATMAPASALPIGAGRTLDETQCLKVLPSEDLDHAILGLTHPSAEGHDLGETNLLGFVWV